VKDERIGKGSKFRNDPRHRSVLVLFVKQLSEGRTLMFSWQGKSVQKCDSGEHLEGQGTVILKCCFE